MNIGCDLDGVIVDHRRNQQRLLRARNVNLPPESISKKLIKQNLTPEDYESFKDELYGNLSLTADEIPGAHEALSGISRAGHVLYLISRREQGQKFARIWLEDHGYGKIFPQKNIFFVTSDEEKETVCRLTGIELHIDDTPDILDMLRTPRYKILFSRTPETGISFTDKTTADWHGILKYIEHVENRFDARGI